MYFVGRVFKEKVVGEDVGILFFVKKVIGRKKFSLFDFGVDVVFVIFGDIIVVKVKIFIKKGRGNLEKNNLDFGLVVSFLEKERIFCFFVFLFSIVKYFIFFIGFMLV